MSPSTFETGELHAVVLVMHIWPSLFTHSNASASLQNGTSKLSYKKIYFQCVFKFSDLEIVFKPQAFPLISEIALSHRKTLEPQKSTLVFSAYINIYPLQV